MASPFFRNISTHSLTPDQPNLQPFYYFHRAAVPPQWRPASSSADIAGNHHHQQEHPQTQPNPTLHLLTWNIDFQVPYPVERMTAALHHLHTILTSHNNTTTTSATVILFQEMTPSTLDVIQSTPWIRDNFYITNLSPARWRMSSYGTTTLIDRRLDLKRVFRVPYAVSYMRRDALFVDIGLELPSTTSSTSASGGGGGGGVGEERILRLCNTHLESLASGTPRRPVQMHLASRFMHGLDKSGLPTPHAAILAGDLNAFAPDDLALPESCGLRDAFLVLGGVEDTEESYTWGKQNTGWLVGRFPDARLDKVLFCGGVEEDVWVTDHYGLEAEIVITTMAPDAV
ncbi:Endonuclease/exonuclease/phosphatase [Aspergillus pseudodeflectus]|uniref:Endonuclease/exonuclease/phosphatase n=1 Tax=Aspergillus pseudodeflectus TaxID=176178 RepID=A0ABR4JBX8_9EURO